MKVSTESMSASASSSLAAAGAAAAAPAAAITDRLATRLACGTATSPPRRWLFPESRNGACNEDGGEEVEVEGRKAGDART